VTSAAPDPRSGTLIYDEECALCSSWAAWAAQGGGVKLAPAGSPKTLAQHHLSPDQVSRSAWFVDAAGNRLEGAAALNAVLRTRSGAWPLLGRIGAYPMVAALESRLYRVLASRRHRRSST